MHEVVDELECIKMYSTYTKGKQYGIALKQVQQTLSHLISNDSRNWSRICSLKKSNVRTSDTPATSAVFVNSMPFCSLPRLISYGFMEPVLKAISVRPTPFNGDPCNSHKIHYGKHPFTNNYTDWNFFPKLMSGILILRQKATLVFVIIDETTPLQHLRQMWSGSWGTWNQWLPLTDH